MESGLMMEDLLNFTLDVDHDDDRSLTRKSPLFSLSESSDPNNSNTQDPDDHGGFPLPEFAEEELEWLNAFPEVETCLDILSDNPAIDLDHQSPVSVLDNGTSNSSNNNNAISYNGGILVPLRHPVKARSKLTRPRRGSGFLELPQPLCWMRSQGSIKNPKQGLATAAPQPRPPPQSATTIGRRCQHCQAEKTPQWRAGPMGPKTLCNACGVRFKSGRLVPEYRPANSPTFSRLLHSNSHRQVMEMRRQKQRGEGMVFNEACGYKL